MTSLPHPSPLGGEGWGVKVIIALLLEASSVPGQLQQAKAFLDE